MPANYRELASADASTRAAALKSLAFELDRITNSVSLCRLAIQVEQSHRLTHVENTLTLAVSGLQEIQEALAGLANSQENGGAA